MQHVVNTPNDIATITNISVGDIVVHKNYEFSVILRMLQKKFGLELELFPAQAGTSIYEQFGHRTSVISRTLQK